MTSPATRARWRALCVGFRCTGIRLALLCSIALFWCTAAATQTYPDRTVTIVVPFAAGAPDSVARVMAKQLQSQLGQSVIVENRPAANGTIATDAVARAPADGTTLLITSASIAVNPSIYRKLPYDVLADLTAVASLCRTDGYVLAVNPAVPAKSVRELVVLAREPDRKLAYGSPGVGNTLHLAGELFKARTGIDLIHVPYRGAGPAISDLLGGQIQVMFVTPPLSLAHIQAGKLRPLAFTGATRWSVLPDVPTMAEAGVPDFVMDGGWYGLFAPGKLPTDIAARLHREVATALAAPQVQKSFATLGLAPFETSPAGFRTFLAEQVRAYAELVKIAGIEPQ
jgi:tripartite-type tricarboxylate transporter receptor subunit TctC